jgi:hypothetical protein
MGVEEGEEIQTKGRDNLFNSIIPEMSPISRKGRIFRCSRLSEHKIDRISKETQDILLLKY